MIFSELLYDAGLLYYKIKNESQSELIFDEIFKFFDVIFLVLIFRIFHKIIFYKHQYLSLIIILLVGLVRYFIIIIYDVKIKDFEYISFLFLIFFSFIDSIKIYFLTKII